MDVEQLKEDVLAGQITLDRLIEVVVTSQRELQAAAPTRPCVGHGVER